MESAFADRARATSLRGAKRRSNPLSPLLWRWIGSLALAMTVRQLSLAVVCIAERRMAGQFRFSFRWHSLPRRSRARRRGDSGEQDGENAGEEDAVECPGAADRGDRRAEVGDLIQIKKIGADQRSHGAAQIG